MSDEKYFRFHENEDILRRLDIFRMQENGFFQPGSLEYSLVFRPATDGGPERPEDVKDRVLAEAKRRGLIV